MYITLEYLQLLVDIVVPMNLLLVSIPICMEMILSLLIHLYRFPEINEKYTPCEVFEWEPNVCK